MTPPVLLAVADPADPGIAPDTPRPTLAEQIAAEVAVAVDAAMATRRRNAARYAPRDSTPLAAYLSPHP